MHGNFPLYSSNRLGFFLTVERLETLHQREQRPWYSSLYYSLTSVNLLEAFSVFFYIQCFNIATIAMKFAIYIIFNLAIVFFRIFEIFFRYLRYTYLLAIYSNV